MARDWMVKESELEKDDYEYRVLHAVLDRSCIVSGCAGSGKSVLALIKAKRIQQEKLTNDYQIIVYTKALCRYMNAGRKELNLNNEFSFHQEWKFNRVPKIYANGRTYMVYEKDALGNLIPKNPLPSADYTIVDEIQDFSKEEIAEFIRATRKQFFFFGDTAQSIYKGIKNTLPVNRISAMIPEEKDYETFNLCHNYRLPLPVAEVVQYVGVGLPMFNKNIYKSAEKVVPRFVRYNDFVSQIDAIARLIKSGIDVSDVGILVPNNEDVKRVHDSLDSQNINHEVKYEDKENWRNNIDNLDFTTVNPKVMTYHSAKGLQFGTVILPAVAEQRDEAWQKALYVAMTRTYRNLYVMYSGSLPYPLSEVPSNLYKTTEKDVVEDI